MRVVVFAVALAVVAAACGGTDVITESTSDTTSTTGAPPVLLVDVLEARGDFSTFLDLARRAGLEGTLLDDGPITVFAPTDAAFAAADADILAGLAADPEALRQALLYHMVADALPSATVTGRGFVTTMAGFNLDLEPTEGGLLANDVAVSELDLVADNGFIHVADAVLFIPSILDVLRQSGTFGVLIDALTDEQLEMLDTGGPFTFFATADLAFGGPDGGKFREIAGDPAKVDAWFLYHLVDGATNLAALRAVPEIQTLLGIPLPIGERGEFTTAGGADVVITDVPSANGIIHIVDDLYFPPEPPTDGGDEGSEGEELEE
jgi:uncharacterized surface protein with fasciclin (FAS1) repeats